MVSTLLLGLLTLSERAAYGPWESAIVGGGGYMMGVRIAPSDPRRVYSFVDVGGAYRSDDGGQRWKMLHGAFGESWTASVSGLSVHPKNKDDILVLWGDRWIRGEGILRSRNGGKTFEMTQKAAFFGNGEYRWMGSAIDRHPKNPEIVAVASPADGVLISRDGGSTWKAKGLPMTYFTHIQFDLAKPSSLIACATPWKGYAFEGEREFGGGLFRSEDLGETWVKLADEAPGEIFQHPQRTGLLVGIFGDRKIKSSSDGGRTWTDFAQGLPQDDSPNLGWQSGGRYQALAGGPGYYAAASTAGLFYTRKFADDAWTQLPAPKITEKVEGEPWHAAAKPGSWRHFASALSSLTIDPANPKRWFFTDWYAVYESRDGGLSWDLRIDGIETTVIHGFGQFPDDKGPILMGMADNGGFASTNKGKRFAPSLRNSNAKMFSVCRSRPEVVYAVGDEPGKGEWKSTTVFASADRGMTWTTLPSAGLPSRADRGLNTVIAHPRDPKTLWVALSGPVKQGEGGLYKSEDGGQTFRWDSEGMTEGDDFFWQEIWQNGEEAAIGPDLQMMAVSQRLGKVWTRKSPSEPWKPFPTSFAKPAAVVADWSRPGRFLAAAESGIYEIMAGEASAKKILEGAFSRLAQDQVRPQWWVAGGVKGVVVSLNGGASFSPAPSGLPQPSGAKVGFGQGRLFVGTGGSGVFSLDMTKVR